MTDYMVSNIDDDTAEILVRLGKKLGILYKDTNMDSFREYGSCYIDEKHVCWCRETVCTAQEISLNEFIGKMAELNPPIKIGNEEVKFNTDGSIRVGCETISSEKVDKIIEKRKEVSAK
ncbi:MAG: hypothetical protein ACYSUK_00065 [Planctomycetota bacterium]|jgi:hypothetical protein